MDESCSDLDMYDEGVERLLYYCDDAIAVGIIRVDQGFELHCFDHVVNYWRERYPTLSAALARMALLIHLGEGQWRQGFKDEPAAFSVVVAMFHSDNAR